MKRFIFSSDFCKIVLALCLLIPFALPQQAAAISVEDSTICTGVGGWLFFFEGRAI